MLGFFASFNVFNLFNMPGVNDDSPPNKVINVGNGALSNKNPLTVESKSFVGGFTTIGIPLRPANEPPEAESAKLSDRAMNTVRELLRRITSLEINNAVAIRFVPPNRVTHQPDPLIVSSAALDTELTPPKMNTSVFANVQAPDAGFNTRLISSNTPPLNASLPPRVLPLVNNNGPLTAPANAEPPKLSAKLSPRATSTVSKLLAVLKNSWDT